MRPLRRGIGAAGPARAASGLGLAVRRDDLLYPRQCHADDEHKLAWRAGRGGDSTIIGGILQLVHHGEIFIPLVIFVASVMVPIGKFIAIIWLALVAGKPATHEEAHSRLKIYEVVEFIGRWSMIDVFVVAILSALVQLGFLVSIKPGPAAASFALSVAFTMLAAQSFDPRLIWRGLPLRRRKDVNE